MKITEIAKLLDYEYVGNTDENISGVRFYDMAEEDDIAIVKKDCEISATNAKTVLTEPRLLITNKSLLYTHEPIYVSAVKIAMLLIKNGEKISRDFEIGDNCIIEPDVYIGKDVIIGNNVILHSGARIGASAFYHYEDLEGLKTFHGLGKVIISDDVEIGYNTVVQRGTFGDTFIGRNTKVGNLVEIGHDVRIGSNCKIVSQVGIAGNAFIGNDVKILGQSGVANFVRINDGAKIMARTSVIKNVKSGAVISGNFGKRHSEVLRQQAKIEKLFGLLEGR